MIAGDNYGQGSSREHAALAPRFLGLRLVLAEELRPNSLAKPSSISVCFHSASDDPTAYDRLESGDHLRISGLHSQIRESHMIEVECPDNALSFRARHELSARQVEVVFAGGLINWVRQRAVQTA